MSDHAPTPPLLEIISKLVPSRQRHEWLSEWRGEFAHISAERRRSSWFGMRRNLDAIEDALRLRLRRARRDHSGTSRGALWQDIRYGLRALWRRPGYSAGVIVTLALGIGANTAIFSVVNGVLFHRLPYAEPDRLVMLWGDASARGIDLVVGSPPADFLQWRESTRSFVELAALRNGNVGLLDLGEPVVPLTHFVTVNYFDLLGVQAALGRTFAPEDESGDRTVILSHGIWLRVFGGDVRIIGDKVLFDEQPHVVVGVLPPDFHSVHQLPVQPDLWVPLSFVGHEDDRSDRRLGVFARLRDGVTVLQAREEMIAIGARLAAAFPETHKGWSVRVEPVQEQAVGAYRQTFRFLLLAVGLVLLIACANVANLGLVQAAERSREVALRAALGAGHLRIVRQLLSESLLLALAGGLVGLLAAVWMMPLIINMIPGAASGSASVGGAAAVPFLEHVRVDTNVLAFTLVVSLITGLVSGLIPARRAALINLNGMLREGGRGAAGGRRVGRLRGALVVAEVALSLVLLAGAGLMLQSFRNIRGAEFGYDVDRLLTLRNSLRIGTDREAWVAHFEEAAERLATMPGVESASAVSFVPPEFPNSNVRFHRPGEVPDDSRDPIVVIRTVTPRYFETMGIPLLQGRVIDERDTRESAPALLVNAEFRRRYFGGRNPVGEHIVPDLAGSVAVLSGARGEIEVEIVGVVGDVRGAGTDPSPLAMAYLPATQVPRPIMNLVVRTRDAPEKLLRQAEDALWSIGRRMNVYSVETLARRQGNLMWQSRFSMQVLGLFATLALILGAAGIYAVLSYSVSRRTREMGVRVALGAERRDVLRLVIGDGLRLVAAGVAIGALASVLVTRLLAGLLYGVAPGDPLTLAGVATVIVIVAASACAVPGLRASRVDPIEALRAE